MKPTPLSTEKPAFILSRSGVLHDFHCFALTHDGPCQCPFVLRRDLPPRRRPRDVYLDTQVSPNA